MKKPFRTWLPLIVLLTSYCLGVLGVVLYHYFRGTLSYFEVGNSLFFFGLFVVISSLLPLNRIGRIGIGLSKEIKKPEKFLERWKAEKPDRMIIFAIMGAGLLLLVTGYILTWIR